MSDESYPFIERVLEHWRARRVPYLPGVAKEQLQTFEREKNLRLPVELRAFYLATNGVRVPGTMEVDDKNYDFWPLEKLQVVEGEPSKLYFADFQQSTWTFAIELEGNETANPGAVYVADARFIPIADSFAEFMNLYIADDPLIYPITWKAQ